MWALIDTFNWNFRGSTVFSELNNTKINVVIFRQGLLENMITNVLLHSYRMLFEAIILQNY